MSKQTKSDNKRVAITKTALLKAMENSLGVVTIACNQVGCSRDTYYRYLKEDEEFAQGIDSIADMELDFVISQQHKLIAGITTTIDGKTIYKRQPCGATIRHYLDSKGARAGYSKSIDLNIKQEQPLFPYDDSDLVDMSDD